jgi:hypothetical protein
MLNYKTTSGSANEIQSHPQREWTRINTNKEQTFQSQIDANKALKTLARGSPASHLSQITFPAFASLREIFSFRRAKPSPFRS